MIVVFGSDGFLGDRMVAKLQGVRDANLSYNEVDTSVCGSPVITFTDKDDFFHFLLEHYREVTWVIYCDKRIPNTVLSVFRYEFVQKLWTLSASYSIPLLYVFHQPAESPLSDFKADIFEQWTGKQYRRPPFWYIFRVGEVYGPHEERFGEFTSRIHMFYRQILETGEAVLPMHDNDIDREGALRDYLYVQDAVRVFYWFMLHRPANGVYDLGSGFARTDFAVVNAIFRALKLPTRIRHSASSEDMLKMRLISFQPDLRILRTAGYRKPFFSVEKGVKSALRDAHRT